MQTRRLPHKQTLLEFLSLYVKFRTTPQSTFQNLANIAKDGAERIFSIFTRASTVSDRLTDIVSNIKAKIETAQDFDDFYRLLILLRQNAQEAQKLKYLEGNSMLCVTLHAMASMIICELREYPEFIARIKKLKETAIATEKSITEYTLGPKKGQGVEGLEEKLYKTYWKLAVLGKVEFYNKAKLYNVYYTSLSHNIAVELPLPDKKPSTIDVAEYEKKGHTANYAAPLVLQDEFGEWFYNMAYQKDTLIDFNRFIEKSIDKESESKTGEEQKPLNEGSQKTPSEEDKKTPVKTTTELKPGNEGSQITPSEEDKKIPVKTTTEVKPGTNETQVNGELDVTASNQGTPVQGSVSQISMFKKGSKEPVPTTPENQIRSDLTKSV